MSENVLTIKLSLTNIKTKKGRKTVLTKIKKYVCALLNTNGGELILTASDATADNKIDADKVIQPIEQYFEGIIGTYEVHRSFHVSEENYNTIALDIQALTILCSLNTNLFLPTNTEKEMWQISCMNQDALRHILFQRRIAENSEHKVPKLTTLPYGCDCGFHESKTVLFKLLKTEKTNKCDFADRVINNQLKNIISGFANANGGNIFYGINDNGIVEGELLPDSEHNEVTKKLEKAVGKMIWRDKSRKVERGREWDIKFVPVKDCNNEAIPSTFVMVVTVHPYIGGVFTKEPESYYVEDGEVKKMPFDSWKQNTYYKVATPVQEMERSSWSSEENRRSYMKITQRLENFRQFGNWEMIERITEEAKVRKGLPVNTKLTCLFQHVASSYYQGQFIDSEFYLSEYCKDMDSAEDKSAFATKERYSASAIERARGNYQEAWNKIEEGLKLAHNAPAGNISAAVYANAASILRFLVDDKSFIDEIKKDKDSKSKIRAHIERGKSFCHHALQHLLYIEDEFEIAREDLKQRIEITLASLCVKLADPELSSSSPDNEINEAIKLVKESEDSLVKMKGEKQLTYNSCRQLLVKSDIYFLMYKLEGEHKNVEHLKKSALEIVEIARKRADDKGFKEIKLHCDERSQRIERERKLENDEEKVEEIVDELLA